MRHGGSGHEVSADGSMTLLSCYLFFHQVCVSFLLFYGAVLGTQWGFENVVEFSYGHGAIFWIKEVKVMDLSCYAGIV